MAWMTKESEFTTWQEQQIFLFSIVQTGSRLTHRSVRWVPGALFFGCKVAGE
jgi:hypothetical protein